MNLRLQFNTDNKEHTKQINRRAYRFADGKCHLQFKQNLHYIYRRKKEAVRNRLEGSSEY
nr:MAG TPA: hypothetical protein [Caudoviricetes sp.]